MSEEKKKPHPLDRAWAAGVFEANMAFPKAGAVLRFERNDYSMMSRFHRVVGVGKLLERDLKKGSAIPVHIFQTTNLDDARELLLLVAPFLSARKTEMTASLLAKIERNPTWRKKHPEKASSSVISPAQAAAPETTGQSTATDGRTASDAKSTGS